MGSCASIHRNSNSSGKFRASLVHSETDKNPNSMPCTPVKNNPASVLVVDRPIGSQFSSVTSISNYGSKEEAFFDSQPWLDSDCDDDFYSVKGDFTPSRGSTPIHSSRAGTPSSRTLSPQLNRALFERRSSVYEEPNRSLRGTTPQVDSNGIDSQEHGGALTNASPSEKKRKNKLGDLFHESTRENGQDEFNPETPKSSNSTPYISGSNSQSSSAKRTPRGEAIKSAQCCFPRLPSARGLKKTFFAAPPTISVDA